MKSLLGGKQARKASKPVCEQATLLTLLTLAGMSSAVLQ